MLMAVFSHILERVKNLYSFIAACLLFTACSGSHVIEVYNPSDFARQEMVEIDRPVFCKEIFSLFDGNSELPYQLTSSGKLIFPIELEAGQSKIITVRNNVPSAFDTIATGAFYPERLDDLAWENDRAAYRAYGPALQASGEQAYGYDIWTKSVAEPVVKARYDGELKHGRSYHHDYGNGMDAYSVGPTLGGGTAAGIDSLGGIIYPRSFTSYDILDNGPLRFTVRLTYDGSETRIISLDANEFLNRTEVCFEDSSFPEIAPGIVIHRHNPEGYLLSPNQGFMAYADLTDNPDNSNGTIFVGVVMPKVESMRYLEMEEPSGDAIGHILSPKSYNPGDTLVYYWGSGWSKGFMPDWEAWTDYLAKFHQRITNPLEVTIK